MLKVPILSKWGRSAALESLCGSMRCTCPIENEIPEEHIAFSMLFDGITAMRCKTVSINIPELLRWANS